MVGPGGLELNIQAEGHQSNAVTTVLTNDIDMPTLRRLAEEQAGLVLGVPLAGFEGRAFRIGHMGHLNPPMLLGTLGTIESVLIQMNAPMGGSGVAAAAAHIGPTFRGDEPTGAQSTRLGATAQCAG